MEEMQNKALNLIENVLRLPLAAYPFVCDPDDQPNSSHLETMSLEREACAVLASFGSETL